MDHVQSKMALSLPANTVPVSGHSLQIKELPTNLSSARIFQLPPGVVLMKPKLGAVAASTTACPIVNPVRPQATEPLGPICMKSPNTTLVMTSTGPIARPVVARPVMTTSGASPSVKLVPIKPAPQCSEVRPSFIPGEITTTTTTQVLQLSTSASPVDSEMRSGRNPSVANNQLETRETAVSTISNGNVKPKPKPWCRDPRPLWRPTEPIVLYSGCPPENLIPPKKKIVAPPESLPCPKKLDDLLPTAFKYHVSSFEKLKNTESFKAEIRTNISNKDDALYWLRDFEGISGTSFRVTKTFKENSHRLVFKKCYKCHKNTYRKDQVPKRESKRHVGCEARLSITVKNPEMKSSTDLLLAEFPCVIAIYHNHCHSLNAPDALRYRRPLPEIKEKFADMFRNKITPSTALKVHMADLKREYGDKYEEVIKDGAKCPLLPWCYRHFYETLGKKVKDMKRKSTSKLAYRRKSKRLQVRPLLQENAPVIINFDLEHGVSEIYPIIDTTNVKHEQEQDEIQSSVNSLYEYDLMSKNNVDGVHEMVHSDDGGNHSNLQDNCSVINHGVNDDDLLNHDDFLDNDDAGEAFIDNLGNDDCHSHCEILDHANSQTNDTVVRICDIESKDNIKNYTEAEINIIDGEFQEALNDMSMRLKKQPHIFIPIVDKFLTEYSRACQNQQVAEVVAGLGSSFCDAINPKPSVSDCDEPTLAGGSGGSAPSISSYKTKTFPGPSRRKVLVLRMDPNKFNEMLGKHANKRNEELINR